MSESLSVDAGWEESLDSEQVTHVKGEVPAGAAAAGEWLVNVSEEVVVPMTTTDVVEALRTLRVSDRSLVWRAGMQDWTALGDVPQLRLAAGASAAPSAPGTPPPKNAAASPVPTRTLHPPPKAPARAARDERRRNTLPVGFPVVRDPATIREPTGLQPAPNAAAAEPPRSSGSEVEALAIYERATPSLTFSDSVRAEWQGSTQLLHQPAPSKPPPVRSRPAPRSQPGPKPRLSLEPQSDPRPRLTLEPQSDPMQSERKVSHSQPPGSLAPTTSEPKHAPPARGAGLWGDLSVVLASDMRAVQASSKRLTLIASLGSAALASLLTLWFAHSRTPREPVVAMAARPAPAPAKTVATATSVPVSPTVALAPPAAPTVSAHAPSAVAVHSPAKPAPPRAPTRPKQSAPTQAPADAPNESGDVNPNADASEHGQAKTPTAAFKETALAPATANGEASAAKTPLVPSGLEDSAAPVRPTASTNPGF